MNVAQTGRKDRVWSTGISMKLILKVSLAMISVVLATHPGASRVSGMPPQQLEVEGVVFETSIARKGVYLDLVGAGLLRYRVVFKAYVASLYLERGAPASRVFMDIPKRIEIEYFHAISAQGFIKATRAGIEANVSPSVRERLSSRIDALDRTYRDVQPSDRYAFTYFPGHGSELTLNNEVIGVFEGLDFANAIFSIWIGANPLDRGLKRSLLGET